MQIVYVGHLIGFNFNYTICLDDIQREFNAPMLEHQRDISVRFFWNSFYIRECTELLAKSPRTAKKELKYAGFVYYMLFPRHRATFSGL